MKLVLNMIHVVGDQQPPIFTLVPSMNMAVDDYCGTYLGALNVLLFSSIYIGHMPCSKFCIIIYISYNFLNISQVHGLGKWHWRT
jgi:hypothetical protein